MSSRNRLIAIIAGVAAAIALTAGGIAWANAASSNKPTADAGTRGIASGGHTPSATGASTPHATPTAGATPPAASGAAGGVGAADPNDASLGITVTQNSDANGTAGAGNGAANVQNAAGNQAALAFINEWISANTTQDPGFTNAKIASLKGMVVAGTGIETTHSRIDNAYVRSSSRTLVVGALTAPSVNGAQAADGTWQYTVTGQFHGDATSNGQKQYFTFPGAWTVVLNAQNLVQSVGAENLGGFNQDTGN